MIALHYSCICPISQTAKTEAVPGKSDRLKVAIIPPRRGENPGRQRCTPQRWLCIISLKGQFVTPFYFTRSASPLLGLASRPRPPRHDRRSTGGGVGRPAPNSVLGRPPALTSAGIVGHTATKGCKLPWKRRGWLKQPPEMPVRQLRKWSEVASQFRCRADFSPPRRTKVRPTSCSRPIPNLRWKSLALEDLGVSGNGRSVRA